MQADDTPAGAGHEASRTHEVGGAFMNGLFRVLSSLAEVVARFWPISRTPNEILTKGRRR